MVRTVADGHHGDGPDGRRRVRDQHGQAFDAGGPARRRRRRPAHLFHQAVVAPARQHRALGAQGLGGELERRVTVIVQAAHQVRVQAIGDAGGLQPLAQRVEKLPRGAVQAVGQQRRPGDDGAVALVLGIEDAQGIALQPRETVVGKPVAVFGEVLHQYFPVSVAAFAVAQGVQLQGDFFAHPQRLQDVGPEGDDFHVGHGLGDAQHLHVDLVELALASLLRALVAEHRSAAEKFERQVLGEAVRQDGADHARRTLRAQGDAVSAAVLERIHLLGHDVGGIAQGTREDLRELEDRRRYLGEPVARGNLAGRLLHVAVAQHFPGQDVAGAADRLQGRHRLFGPPSGRRRA